MKKQYKFKKEHITILIGINIAFLSLVFMLSNWAGKLNFLAKGLTFILGFIGFWILIPFLFVLGLYIALRRHLLKFKIGTSLVGVFLIIFAIGLLTSHWATLNLNISILETGQIVKEAGKITNYGNAIETFKAVFNVAFLKEGETADYIITGSAINGGVLSSSLGGGFFCFVFLGLFNGSGASNKPVLLIVIIVLLFLVGVALVLNRLIAKGFSKLRHKKVEANNEEQQPLQPEPINFVNKSMQEIAEQEAKAATLENQAKEEPEPIVDEITDNEILHQAISSYNFSHGLTKASFDFDADEIKPNSEKQKNEYVRPTLDSYQTESIHLNESSNQNETFNSAVSTYHEPSPIDEPTLNQEPSFEEAKTIPANPYSQPIPQPQVVVNPEPISHVMSQPAPVEKPKERVWEDDIEIKVDIPAYQPRGPYKFPGIDLLESHENPEDVHKNDQSCQARIDKITTIFSDLKIGATVVGHTIGPSVTQFDIQMNANVSVQAVNRYLDDISARLGGYRCRFEGVVTGKSTSSLEVPNQIRTSVGLYDSLIEFPEPSGSEGDLTVPFGKDINGKVVKLSIAATPHMLVAGTTGSGKSVFIHSIILSLIMRNRPEDLKLVLIDPKGVEMSFYKKIPHLICPMIVEPSKAGVALAKLCDEMEKRNNIFRSAGVRELKEFNKIAQSRGWNKMPSIVVFVDEYADISEQCKDIEKHIQRIGQKARTAGIHLVIATQRPSTNIISGVIKANLPTSVALSVSKVQDSMVILGKGGAETLLGNGDMLIDSGKLCRNNFVRVQSCFADVPEINRVCDFLRENYKPMYWDEFYDLTDHSKDIEQANNDAAFTPSQIQKNATDEQLYEQIKEDVILRSHCSISFLQRAYPIGFPKAGKIFARLQQEGIVDSVPESASKGCKVLVHNTQDNSDQGMGSLEQSEIVQNFDPNNQ